VHAIGLPGFQGLELGMLFIPFFALVMLAVYSGGVIDGIDGLSGGIFATMFSAYAGIAFYQQQINLASFCLLIVGGILAFLWFNITPARFFMGDTGSMSLGITLGIIGMLTNSALILMIIGSVFVLEAVSTILQVLSKKIRKKKIFLSAPIHHHFEAKGWSEAKIVMRFWVIAWISAAIGLVIFLLDRLN